MCIYVDDSHQSATFLRTKLCECVFAGFFLHMFLQVSLTVCVSASLLLSCGTLGCVCLSWKETEEESECSSAVFVCVGQCLEV